MCSAEIYSVMIVKMAVEYVCARKINGVVVSKTFPPSVVKSMCVLNTNFLNLFCCRIGH